LDQTDGKLANVKRARTDPEFAAFIDSLIPEV